MLVNRITLDVVTDIKIQSYGEQPKRRVIYSANPVEGKLFHNGEFVRKLCAKLLEAGHPNLVVMSNVELKYYRRKQLAHEAATHKPHLVMIQGDWCYRPIELHKRERLPYELAKMCVRRNVAAERWIIKKNQFNAMQPKRVPIYTLYGEEVK
jgi:hypothetical protein